jgi:hypothetical protein
VDKLTTDSTEEHHYIYQKEAERILLGLPLLTRKDFLDEVRN